MPAPLKILYEDNHLLGVLKPAGIPAQADKSGDPDILTLGKTYIKENYEKPGEVYLGLVHRLDRVVSGPMILARTTKAAARLSEQFRERRAIKTYHALVNGRPPKAQGELFDYIRKDNRNRMAREARKGDKDALEARLEYRLLGTKELSTRDLFRGLGLPPSPKDEKYSGATREIALLEIELITGRFHQIRFQLSQAGFPILGDVKYGASLRIPDRSIALEARSLEIIHPTLKETLILESDERLAKLMGS